MKETQKRQLKSMIYAALFWLLIIGSFFYLISLVSIILFSSSPHELGIFRLKGGRTFELKSFPGNALSSSELHLREITNEDSDNYSIIRTNESYEEFVYWQQLNDSLIQLVLKNKKEKDTVYMMIQKEEISLDYHPDFFIEY